ncbi:MAG TPA: hypothetical protein VJW77_12880 [Terriglobia bacterium]|nr:hypothetical protein [Terriglobia bacterium]
MAIGRRRKQGLAGLAWGAALAEAEVHISALASPACLLCVAQWPLWQQRTLYYFPYQNRFGKPAFGLLARVLISI